MIKQDIRVETNERVKPCNERARNAIPLNVLERTDKPATPEFIKGATMIFRMWWLNSLVGVRKRGR